MGSLQSKTKTLRNSFKRKNKFKNKKSNDRLDFDSDNSPEKTECVTSDKANEEIDKIGPPLVLNEPEPNNTNNYTTPSSSKMDGAAIESVNFTATDYQGIANFDSSQQMKNRGGKNNTLIGMQYVTHIHDPSGTKKSVEKFEATFSVIRERFLDLYGPDNDNNYVGETWIPETLLDYDDLIVDIRMEYGHDWSGRPTGTEVIGVKDLLKIDGPDIPKRILLRAPPGFGKSTLCTAITRQWATGRPGFVNSFDLAIRYNVKDLPGGTESLETELIRFCHSLSNVEGEPSLTRKTLKHFSEQILVVLDGYDETSVEMRKLVDNLVASRGSRAVFSQSTVIVTTRDLDGQNTENFDRVGRIEALGLNMAKCREFIETYFEDQRDKIAPLIFKLEKKSGFFLSGISAFLLGIICHLHSENRLPKMKSVFDIYEALLALHLEKQSDREGLPPLDVQSILFKTGKVFYQLLKDNRSYFTTDELTEELGADNVGLLKASGIVRERFNWMQPDVQAAITEYETLHSLFFTFFATKYLKVKYESLTTNEEKLHFLQQFARVKDFHLSVVDMETDKSALLFRSSFSDGIVFRWNVNPRHTDEEWDSLGSIEMSDDSRDVFTYQFPSVIMVLENQGVYAGFKYAHEFYPPGMAGYRAMSFLAENLTMEQFPVFFYHEYLRQTKGDLIVATGHCVENGRVIWKGRLFCYRRLPPEKFKLFDVFHYYHTIGKKYERTHEHFNFRNFSLKAIFADLTREDNNWIKSFCKDFLRCQTELCPCFQETLSSGDFGFELIQCLKSSHLFKYWRIGMGNAFGPPLINCLVEPDGLRFIKSKGELINKHMGPNTKPLEIMERMEMNFDGFLLNIVGMEAPQAEESSDED